jgi:hypothetical protein
MTPIISYNRAFTTRFNHTIGDPKKNKANTNARNPKIKPSRLIPNDNHFLLNKLITEAIKTPNNDTSPTIKNKSAAILADVSHYTIGRVSKVHCK